MRSTRFFALALAASVMLTGCQSVEPSSPSPAPVSPGISPEPEVQGQQRETGLVRPGTVFDGQCDGLLTAAELASILGESGALAENHWFELWGGEHVVAQAGGLMCTWQGTDSRVIAVALPEAAVDYSPSDSACTETHDTTFPTCPLEVIANGVRLSAMVTRTDAAAAEAARDELSALFAQKAEARSPVPVPLPALGSWQLPPDCDEVVTAADFAAVAGLGAGSVPGVPYGYGKDSPQAWRELVSPWDGAQCVVQGESARVEFVPVGGARWREEEVSTRTDATALSLEGIEAAYGVPYDDGLTLVYAFDGPNMLMFSVRFTKNAAGIATALIASLDATAVA